MAPPTTATEEVLNALRVIIPLPGLLLVVPALYFFFRKSWRVLDEDAQKLRGDTLAQGTIDTRALVAMPLVAIILTLQEYYGGRWYFDQVVHPLLIDYDLAHQHVLGTVKYEELWGFAWWAGARIIGYVWVPFVMWKIIFPRDSLVDLGLRARGFFKHVWIYGLFLGVVLPAMWIVSHEPDFGGYYPFYKLSSRSWLDFLMWEAMYFAQFFALEIFFRGFWLGVLRRSMGSAAIFAMAVPYCMIHYGKPYLEASGAIVAGIALGSLSMRTKSIYQGFLVHITVAGLMDWLALKHRNALPTVWVAPPVDTAVAVTMRTPETLRTARYHAVMWIVITALMIVAMITSLIWTRVRARSAWTAWAKDKGWKISTRWGWPVLEHEEDGLRIELGSGAAGMHTALSARAPKRPVSFRLLRATYDPPDGWKSSAPMRNEIVYTRDEESERAATELLTGEVARALEERRGRDLGLSFEEGAVRVEWSGADPDPVMLEGARAVALALARGEPKGYREAS